MFEISDKVSSIMKQYKLPKRIEITYDENLNATGEMREDGLKYEIRLNPNLIEKQTFDYYFLHEFFHAVQLSESYPMIVCGSVNTELQNIANFFDSLIFDLNLNSQLKKHNVYPPSTAYSCQIDRIKILLEEDINKKQNNNILQYVIFVSVGITQCYYEYDKNVAQSLLRLCQPYLKNIYICTTKLIEAIGERDYSCASGCYSILNNIYENLLGFYGIKQYYAVRR